MFILGIITVFFILAVLQRVSFLNIPKIALIQSKTGGGISVSIDNTAETVVGSLIFYDGVKAWVKIDGTPTVIDNVASLSYIEPFDLALSKTLDVSSAKHLQKMIQLLKNKKQIEKAFVMSDFVTSEAGELDRFLVLKISDVSNESVQGIEKYLINKNEQFEIKYWHDLKDAEKLNLNRMGKLIYSNDVE